MYFHSHHSSNVGTIFQIAMQIREICAGLGYLHAHGIVHLNIKPENLMVSKSAKQMKIIDFGSAKEISVSRT